MNHPDQVRSVKCEVRDFTRQFLDALILPQEARRMNRLSFCLR